MRYIVIHARYGSTRLLGKPLLMVGGKYVLHRVIEQISQVTDINYVRVATDNELIVKACDMLGVRGLITSESNSTDVEHAAEIAQQEGWGDNVKLITVQCDNPFLQPQLIEAVDEGLTKILNENALGISTVCCEINKLNDIFNTSTVKIIRGKSERAAYITRAPVPWDSDRFHYDIDEIERHYDGPALKHINVVGYDVKTLFAITGLKSSLDSVERIELLKPLENEIPILCTKVVPPPTFNVDTIAELKAARNYWDEISVMDTNISSTMGDTNAK